MRDIIARKFGKVIFPKDFVPDISQMPRDYPLQTRSKAINQLDESDVLVVALPRYGMDTSWQIGYATAKGKPIIGVMMEDDLRTLGHGTIWDHWMHGWREKDIFTGNSKLCAALKGFIKAGII